MNGDYNSGLIVMEYHCELIVINTLTLSELTLYMNMLLTMLSIADVLHVIDNIFHTLYMYF